MNEPKYRRVLLKISGEALAGDAHRGLNFDVIGSVCDVVKQCVEAGVQVGIVVGGGNFWRGIKDGGDRMERTRADQMGMLATVINCLALADSLEQRGVEVRVQTAIEMTRIAEPYIRGRAIRHLEKGRVVIFRLRHRQPVLLDGYRRGAPRGGDQRRRHSAGQERRRCIFRRSREESGRREIRRDHL